MQFEYHEQLTDTAKLEDVWVLLCRYDHAFIPPLSARENTYQSNLTGDGTVTAKPRKYFETLKQQSFLIALDDNRVVGFMSFRPEYVNQDLQDDTVTVYVTTVIVEEEQRGKGITTHFYREILRHFKDRPITTRTWSTNEDHLKILRKMGFDEVLRITNGRGEGIHTVYYRKGQKGETDR